MSSDEQMDKECPLCMETFDLDDLNFFPCLCNYQICRFCWHRIRTDENGLCPACRQSYPEEPVFQPLSKVDLQKMKSEKKQKQQQQKNKLSEGRKHLADFRVLQKNLVYVVGLSQRIADPEMLKKNEYFGKYGKITKVSIGVAPMSNSSTPTHTAFIHFMRMDDALRAIQSANNLIVDGRLIRASLGTTKYCSSFLRGMACQKSECMYLHEVAKQEVSFTKEDMHQGKHTEYEKKLYEQLAGHLILEVPNGDGVKTSKTSKSSNHTKRTRTSKNSDRGHPQVLPNKKSNPSDRPINHRNTRRNRVKPSSISPPRSENLAHFSASSENNCEELSPSKAVIADCNQKSTDVNPDEKTIAESPLTDGFSRQTSDSNEDEQISEETTLPLKLTVTEQNAANILPQAINSPNPSSVNFLDHDGDDLGFDPFSESAKALADMLEEENKNIENKRLNTNQIPDKFPVNQDFLSHGHAQMQTEKYATIDPPPGLESQAMFKFRHLMDENQRFDKLLPYSSASYPLPSETETASELAENLSSSLHLSNNSFIHQQQQPHKTPPRMSSSAHKHYSNYMSSQNEYPQQNGFIYPSRMQGTTGQNSIYPPNYCSSYTSESQLSSSNVLERQGLPSQNRTFDNFSQNRLQNSTHQFPHRTMTQSANSFDHYPPSNSSNGDVRFNKFKQNNSSSSLREGLKALLPNVNVRFVTDTEGVNFASHHMNYFIDSSIDNHHPDNLYLDEPTSFSSHSVGAGLNGFRDNNNTQGEDERMWAAPAPPPPPGFDFTPNSNM